MIFSYENRKAPAPHDVEQGHNPFCVEKLNRTHSHINIMCLNLIGSTLNGMLLQEFQHLYR